VSRRYLGVPWVFGIVYSTIGLSLYFALGLVADRGLGLTPLIFLASGLLFVVTTMTYVEGTSMFRERGGSAMMARHAFNELVSFVAGWAILIDYVVVIALAAISVSHYLTPISSTFAHTGWEVGFGGLVIVTVSLINIAGLTGKRRQKLLTVVALTGAGMLGAVIVVGAITSWDPDALTQHLDPFTTPTVKDTIYALVLATVAYAGIEAAADLSPDLEWERKDLKRMVGAGGVLVPALYTGISLVALMTVPVMMTGHGPETALATHYIEEPVLGVVESFQPTWVSDVMQAAVVIVAPMALVWAASTSMLGLSRHVYVLATNRQIPSWLGKLNSRYSTPHVAIVLGAIVAFALVIPGDVVFLAGVYAFGALLAITIAHGSVIRMRMTEPERDRPYRVPFSIRVRGRDLPLPTLIGGLLTFLAWISVIILHDRARWLGGAWMVVGLVGYVVYRVVVEGTSLTKQVTVPEQALMKQETEFEYTRILVPVFGSKLDEDIVSTAGRLADAAEEAGEEPPHIDLIYVIAVPLTVPLNAKPPPDKAAEAERALERAKDIADEYDTVEWGTSVIRHRSIGAGIVAAARDLGSEAIVMGAEPPSKVRGGALLGGVRGSRPDEIGPITEYVLRKAPSPVLLTAPAEA
jgi:basic amino acid/polyamine antiporter, APA family